RQGRFRRRAVRAREHLATTPERAPGRPDDAALGEPTAEAGVDALEHLESRAVDVDRATAGAKPILRLRLENRRGQARGANGQRGAQSDRPGTDDDHGAMARARLDAHRRLRRRSIAARTLAGSAAGSISAVVV